MRPAKLIHFNWKPGIGDPTIGGWVTVVLYLLAMISCWMTARSGIKEQRIWRAISILFLGLGINKQLDLQSALTAAGRVIAFEQGWYGQRQFVQLAFIIFATMVCVSVVITLLIWTRHAPLSTWFALLGTILVIGYVLIRAASFHHIDRFIGTTFLGLRWNWILEMGGITIVLLASQLRRRQQKRAAPV